MWSRIDSTTFSWVSETDNSTTLTVGSFSYMDYNRWVTIDPFTYSCEIRSIIGLSAFGKQITVSPKLKNNHTTGILYIQSSPTWDVTLFGVVPLTSTYSTVTYSTNLSTTASNITTGINNAISDCSVNGGGLVYLPKGDYVVNKKTNIDGCLDLSGKSNINILGDGIGSTNIILNSDNYVNSNVSIFYAPNSQNISFSNLTIDGNQSYVSNLGDISNCIDSNLGQRLLINNVEIIKSPKNGIRLSNFFNFNMITSNIKNSKSNGILITGQTSDLKISGNTFVENESNDLYFNNNSYPSINTNIITENIFIKYYLGTYSIYLDTSDINSISENFVISNNEFNGSSVYFEMCRNVVFNNNIIVSGTTSNPPFETKKLIESFNIQGNVIVNKSSNQHAIKMSNYSYGGENYSAPRDIFISGNTLDRGDCYIINSANVNFTNNKVKRNSFNADGIIYEISDNPSNYNLKDWGYLNILGNQFIDVTGNGITVTCSNTDYKLSNILIADNIIQGLKNGVYITGSIAASFSGFNINTLTDRTSRNWIPNMWQDYYVSIISGFGITTSQWNSAGLSSSAGQTFSILSNDDKKIITIDGTWDIIPGSFSVYQISRSSDNMKYGLMIATPSIGTGTFCDNLLISDDNLINNAYSDLYVYTDYLVNKTEYNQTWIVPSNPEGRIDAPNYSVAIDRTRKFDNKFIKVGNSSKNGWTLSSEIDRQIIVNDSFTFSGSNLSTINGLTPSYTILNGTWSVVSGTWSVVQSECVVNQFNSNNRAIAILTFTSSNNRADGLIKSNFRAPNYTNTNIGIIFRYQDIDNYWMYRFNKYLPGTFSVYLDKFVSGATISLTQSLVSFDSSNLFGLKVNLKGDYISLYYNDFLISTIKDSTFNTQSKHGLISIGTSSTDYFCQNFKILI